MTKWTCVMVAALSSGAWACGNDCDDADARARDKYASCGIDLGDTEEQEDAIDPPACTDERKRIREVFARCVEDASCDAIRGADAAGYAIYASCITGQ